MTEPSSLETISFDQREFRADVRTFLAAHARPKSEVSPWSVTIHTDAALAGHDFEAGRAWQRLLFDHGFAGFTYPTELGGRGGRPWHEANYAEEAAAFDVSSGYITSTIAMLGPTLMQWGTEAQRRALMPRLLSGRDAWCQLFSEPGAGSDLAGLACRAVRDGDEFVVSGQKVWNSAAQWCTRGMLLVRTNPEVPKHEGITFLLFDMSSPGVEVRPLVQANGSRHFNEVFLSEVRVPVSDVLGQVDAGWGVARTVMSNESAYIGSGVRTSVYERLLFLARTYDRADDPIIRQRLATTFIREKILDVLGERIFAAIRNRLPTPVDPSILNLFAAESSVQSGNLVMQIVGPQAVACLPGDEIARWSQAELMLRFMISIGGGTNEVQRNNLAERALDLPREPPIDRGVPWKDVART